MTNSCERGSSKAFTRLVVFLVCLVAAASTCVQGQSLINGAGATFPYPMYSKWFDEYRKVKPDVQINYQSIGSGGGIRQVTEGTVDFGATDGPMNDDQIAAFKQKRGTMILHFPTVLGAAVPAYNVPGVDATLNFTPEALAGIFLGTVKVWNDPLIAKANPDVKLPATDIIVAHRSDGSGTTYVWTDYLSKVSPEWKQKVGKGTAVSWPVGIGGKGNEGVAGLIRQMQGAIGYVELIYAVQNKIPYGNVRNKSGKFVQANLDSVTAAAAGAPIPDDFRVSITDAPGKDAYPVSSFTWLLIPQSIKDSSKKEVIKNFLHWMLTDGQTLTSTLSYAPLPKEVVAREEKAVGKIQ
ncbi:MAG TPA: phosphate ABC transporter substrate-binding protein PstS [Candidatus Angelobacter sp.]|nr:phosphate ABC transporter substrate-binding protein PstS [Candidatus Angelobacter sp.]